MSATGIPSWWVWLYHVPSILWPKRNNFQNVLLRAICRGLNAFPVQRGAADRNAIRQALEMLEAGEILGIFPKAPGAKLLPRPAFSWCGYAGHEEQSSGGSGGDYRYRRMVSLRLVSALKGASRSPSGTDGLLP